MAKYKGHARVVFMDGYAQGWADGMAEARRRPALRYTDAPEVPYVPGGGIPVGTLSLAAVVERGKRRDMARHPTVAELAILGDRKLCEGESFCPVGPGCHICGLTRDEVEILNKAKGGQ